MAYVTPDEKDVKRSETYFRDDNRGTMGEAAAALVGRKGSKLFTQMNGDWERTEASGSGNIITTTGRKGADFFISRDQQNIEFIKAECAAYRAAAEAGQVDPMAPVMDDGTLGYMWIDLPTTVAIQISNDYFNGIPWTVLKTQRHSKAQFYQIVEKYYNEFVCYPHGKLPLPCRPAIPKKAYISSSWEITQGRGS